MNMSKVTKSERKPSSKHISLEIYVCMKTRCQNDNACGPLSFSVVMVFYLELYLIFQ